MGQFYTVGVGSGLGLVFFYLIAYVSLVLFAALVLGLLPVRTCQYSGGSTTMAMLSSLRLRWVWLLVIVNLAGLPPAFFFGPKLGLFSLFLGGSGVAGVCALGVSIFLGWGAYALLGQQALLHAPCLSTSPLRVRTLARGWGECIMLLGLTLVVGFFFLDDLLVVSW